MYYRVLTTMEENESSAATVRERMMDGATQSLAAWDSRLRTMPICTTINRIYSSLDLFLASQGVEVKRAAHARQALMLHLAKTKVLQQGKGMKSAAVVVRQGTRATTAKRQFLARLAKTVNRAKTEVRHRGVVRWQTADAPARLDTQVLIARQQILAPLEAMAKRANTKVSLRGVVRC